MHHTTNIIKKIITIILIFILILFTTKVYAAGFSASANTSLTAGDTTSLSITASDCGGQFKISSSNSSVVSVSSSSEWIEKETRNVTLTAKSAGTATITVTAENVAESSGDNDVTGSKKVTITVKNKETPDPTPSPSNDNGGNNGGGTDAKVVTPTETKTTTSDETTKSSNNSLKSLTVSKGNLDPEFNRSTKEYTVDLSNEEDATSINSITIGAKAENSKATVSGTGDKDLSDGENNFDINVTAEDGTETTYKVKVIKPKKLTQSDLRLKTLEVNKINTAGQIAKVELNKAFNAETFDYTCNLEKDIDRLDITANVDNDNILVEISGDKNLTGGTNKATITLTSKDDPTVKSVYTITANKAQDTLLVSTEPETDNGFKFDYKMAIYIGAGVVGLLILILIILLIVNKKQKKAKETSNKENTENNDENQEFANNDSNNEENDESKSKLDFVNGEPTYKVDTENSADNNLDTDKEESENIEEDKSEIDKGIEKIKDLEKSENIGKGEEIKENEKNISLKTENDENNYNTENEKYSDNYYINDDEKDKKHNKHNKGKRFL